ncbi:flavodoxin family protein [Pelotomaculum propionicicum]|uniref:2-amino-4-deoxychorismate dehydrogenase n=1 Tax=Pelotomaculum propionicicum TaxID=258475 RepID=A0A4Y7RUJ1_9FIRM|nr:flavodoxin family protein [Pelotomaculum propionicicum]NLI11331.1 flavodoxin family protein [Peptococcaceae bacterium]TEB12440.1 2-amino-4-deoxychorismate dehydrogenase [Pelotomaculum propionicicum]
MKILAINGSHRKGKNTATLLNTVLDEAAALGASTELLELSDLNIKFCAACNKCLNKTQCSITDDMAIVEKKLLAADGILLGSPVYWVNVTTLMKNFMDRSRYLHLYKNVLDGKVGAALTTAGLLYGGQETTLKIMECFLQFHGLHVVDSRDPNEAIMAPLVAGSLMEGFKDGKVIWRRNAVDDELLATSCKQLARNMVKLIRQLNK